MEKRYLIIADDFTGVNDTGVQLKRRGYPTEVLFAGKPVDSQKLIVIDTESRNALPDHVYEIVRYSLEQVDLGQFRYIIKKVDSTTRGNIAQEVKAVDDVFCPELVVFAPALPALGRTIMGGAQCLNGMEIRKTGLPKDSKNPVMEDNLVKLSGQVYGEPVLLKYLPDVRSQSFSLDGGWIFVCDAELDDDPKRIITAIRQDGRRALYVGTAGMADNMMELGKPTFPSSGAVASINSVVNEQMHYRERARYVIVKVPVAQLMTGATQPEEYRDMAAEYLKSGRDTIPLADMAYDRELIELSQEVEEESGMDLTEVGDYVRSFIGRMAKEVLDSIEISGIYLIGGDTALGMLMDIGVDGPEILAEILVGAPLVRVKGGACEGFKLVTKAGAFGTEDAAALAMRKIKERGGIQPTREFLPSCGKEIPKAEVEEGHPAGVLASKFYDYKALMEETQLVQEAPEHPIGTPRPCDMAIDKKKIVVISSDHTRPVPNYIIMSFTLKEICRGNPDADITVLISTGLHRGATREELESRFGPEITEHEAIIVHDCDDTGNTVHLGKLPPGGNMYINRLAMEADLLVAEGSIEPHFFAGFSGGRKSVFPGVASRETVMYNHNSAFADDLHSRTGIIEGNPIHNDMLYVVRVAGLDFIVSVVTDSTHNPTFAVAGDCDLAHRAGRDLLASKCQVDAVPADIVVSINGGYPLDQSIYQSVKGMAAAEATVREGGVIIMLSKAADGHGGKYFHETLRDEKDLNRMMKTSMDRKPEETITDQWQSQIFARVMLKVKVVFVSSCDDKPVEESHIVPVHTMEEALNKAKAMANKEDYKVMVIPDGVSVIVRG